MLQHGAQKNAKDDNGWTPLMWSVWARHPQTVGVLLRHRVDMEIQDENGMSALHIAVSYGTPGSEEINIIQRLLAQRANPHLADSHGLTSIQMAQQTNRPDLIALLRKYGAKK